MEEELGRLPEAVRLAVQAAKVASAHAGASPQLAEALYTHTRLLWQLGLPDRALALTRQAHEMCVATGDAQSVNAARIQGNLGWYGVLHGIHPHEALEHLRQSLATLQSLLPKNHVTVRNARHLLDEALRLAGSTA